MLRFASETRQPPYSAHTLRLDPVTAFHFSVRRRLQIALVWCLLVSLPLMGLSSALTGLLGPQHFHRDALVRSAPPLQLISWLRQVPVLAELRAMRQRAHAESHRTGEAHSHLSRHHHEASDTSVVELDGGGAAEGAATAEPVGLPLLALATGIRLWLIDGLSLAWPQHPAHAYRSAATVRQERPPKA